jgi:hypothetical protein
MLRLLARVATVVVALFLALHGLVYLMGVDLLWKLGEPGDLTYEDAVPTPGTAGRGASRTPPPRSWARRQPRGS